ncbi:hypothetical protein J4434_02765 [Candidatus Woesearchaeota archaeon]|nr:hypothetical protein [Candidatus Woesearchaeota archaeon]
MFSKIKGLMESEEKISEIHGQLTTHCDTLKQQTEIIKELHNEITNLKTNFTNFHSENSNHLNQFQQELGEIKNTRNNISEELNELKLLKTHIKQRLVEELTNEFKTELKSEVERIKTDVKSYNDLKQTLQGVVITIANLKGEIEKFNNIAKDVKEKDFLLERHAKQLQNFADEKVELLQKINTLERLIGKERRRS